MTKRVMAIRFKATNTTGRGRIEHFDERTGETSSRLDRKPVERAGHTFPPGKTVEVTVRPDLAGEIRACKDLRVLEENPIEGSTGFAPEGDLEVEAAREALKVAEQELSDARQAEASLRAEADQLAARLKQAQADELEAKKAAALAGDSVRVASELSEAPALREEADDLGFKLWAAAVRIAESEAVRHEAARPVKAAEEEILKQQLAEIDAQLSELQQKRQDLAREAFSVSDSVATLGGRAKRAREEATRLQAVQPEPVRG